MQDAEGDQDELRSRASNLTAQIGTLRAAALGDDSSARGLEAQIDALDPVVGQCPGRRIGRAHRGRRLAGGQQRCARPGLDLDLQVLANGLWQADAEAVAINGHRLSGLTAIRSAGDAITVDYRSLSRPYRIEAIGNPRTLQARFVESPAGVWWNDLAQNRRMRYEISDVKDMELAADPGIVLRYAKRTS